MKDFAYASFSPEKIDAMTSALQSAIDTLPEPVSSRVIHCLAEAILRAAGTENPAKWSFKIGFA